MRLNSDYQCSHNVELIYGIIVKETGNHIMIFKCSEGHIWREINDPRN